MNKKDYITLYLCNGNDPLCPYRGTCEIQNYPTDCKHTSNPTAAEFNLCENPWRHPDRFKRIVINDKMIQFWEKYPIDKLYHYCDGNFDDRDAETK